MPYRWRNDNTDTDGNTFIADASGPLVYAIDAKTLALNAGFTVPGVNRHWAAAADGKFYANGIECLPGGFGSPGAPNMLSWRFPSIDPLGLPLSEGSMSIIGSDQVLMQGPFAGSFLNSTPRALSHYKWVLPSNFDYQVDYDLQNIVGTSLIMALGVAANIDGIEGDNKAYIYRNATGSNSVHYYLNGVFNFHAAAATPFNTGKLRIVRSGTQLTFFYHDGIIFQQVGPPLDNPAFYGDLFVFVWFSGASGSDGDATFSNPTLNSGSYSNRSGMYREPQVVDKRGSELTYPDNAIIVPAGDGATIINPDSDKVYARISKSSSHGLLPSASNLFHNIGSNFFTGSHIASDSGLVLFPFTGAPHIGTENGGVIMVDLATEVARYFTLSGSSIVGGFYRGDGQRAVGDLRGRDDGEGWSGSDSSFAIRTQRVDGLDLLTEVTDTPGPTTLGSSTLGSGVYGASQVADKLVTNYIAIAMSEYSGAGGIDIFQIERFNNLSPVRKAESVVGAEGGYNCRFDRNGDLYWCDTGNVHRALEATWKAAIGGSQFLPNHTIATPGIYLTGKFDVVNGDVFYCKSSDANVYRVAFPSGSPEQLFGPPGSGATYEIFIFAPDAVVSVRRHPTLNTLIASAYKDTFEGRLAYLVIIDLDTNSMDYFEDISAEVETGTYSHTAVGVEL